MPLARVWTPWIKPKWSLEISKRSLLTGTTACPFFDAMGRVYAKVVESLGVLRGQGLSIGNCHGVDPIQFIVSQQKAHGLASFDKALRHLPMSYGIPLSIAKAGMESAFNTTIDAYA
ncbi:hypothetical protein L873DRAFT_88151 [Choiromyces venosus 120613-1]|uniref:Uncharacterized protein n=1 Tax=Choiromyces venosus 120613-1 TaxID=1336337 RepID=A0A3N4K5F0_9PEZI|nr:hypothetical protein L873DRAFT_88151 [Choiromyces venosus 120613-1]